MAISGNHIFEATILHLIFFCAYLCFFQSAVSLICELIVRWWSSPKTVSSLAPPVWTSLWVVRTDTSGLIITFLQSNHFLFLSRQLIGSLTEPSDLSAQYSSRRHISGQSSCCCGWAVTSHTCHVSEVSIVSQLESSTHENKCKDERWWERLDSHTDCTWLLARGWCYLLLPLHSLHKWKACFIFRQG